MSFLQTVVFSAFPFLKEADPMLLAPVLALVFSFSLVGIFGLFLALQDYVKTQKV